MFCCLLFQSVSPLPIQIRLPLPLWNALRDVFNADLSHYVFTSFQAFHNHSSKSTFITFCFWRLHPFKAELLLAFFLRQSVLYASTQPNDRVNYERSNSLPLSSLFPVDGNSSVIYDLPLLKLRLALFPKVKLVCLCSCRPHFGTGVYPLDIVFRNPFHEETLELCLHFTIQGVSLEQERWFSKKSYPVKHEVPPGETEVLSGDTLSHGTGAPIYQCGYPVIPCFTG